MYTRKQLLDELVEAWEEIARDRWTWYHNCDGYHAENKAFAEAADKEILKWRTLANETLIE